MELWKLQGTVYVDGKKSPSTAGGDIDPRLVGATTPVPMRPRPDPMAGGKLGKLACNGSIQASAASIQALYSEHSS